MNSAWMTTTGVLLALALATPAWGQRDERGRIANAFDDSIWQQRDTNNDGKLTWQEYVQGTDDVREVIIRKRLFTRADLNGDGEVTRQEAAQWRQALPGGRGQVGQENLEQAIKLSDQEIAVLEQAFDQRAFEQMDRNNDGSLSLGEFLAAAPRAQDVDERRRLFQLIDIDNNNQVTRFEVQQVLDSGIGRTVMLPIVLDVFTLLDQTNNRHVTREAYLAGLSGAALAAAQRGFDVIDRNNSGTISPRELDSFLIGRLGEQAQGRDVLATPRSDDAAATTVPADPAPAAPAARRGNNILRQGWLNSFNAYDHNNDGTLSLEELVRHYKGEQAQQARETFYADDSNYDGQLTREELRAGLGATNP